MTGMSFWRQYWGRKAGFLTMKKAIKLFICSILLLACIPSVGAKAATRCRVIIPDYEIELFGGPIYYRDSLYPFISYKDITYFPMTYDYCRALGLSTYWDADDGLYIAHTGVKGTLPIYETANNYSKLWAYYPSYNIYVNGKAIDNLELDYPLLNFRGVTYFPMTYDFSKEFFWDLSFTPEKFTIKNENENRSAYLYKTKDGSTVFEIDTWETYYKEPDFIYTVYPTLATRNEKTEYYRLNTDELTIESISEAEKAPTSMFEDFTFERIEVSEQDGKFFVDGLEIKELDFDAFKETYLAHYADAKFSLLASKMSSDELVFYEIDKLAHYSTNVNVTSKSSMTYIKIGEELVPFRYQATPEESICVDGNIYFTARRYMRTLMTHYSDQSMLFMQKGGTDKPISLSEEYGIYHAEILGSSGDKLYLKLTFSSPEGSQEINIADSGYYTFDGENLVKIHSYLPCGYEIFKDDGTIYTVDFFRKEIKKLS